MTEQSTPRYTHESLRGWGEALDREQPQSIGERLLCYADDWRTENTALREQLAALSQPADTSALDEVRKQERERCAKVCEDEANSGDNDPYCCDPALLGCAAAIRAME